MAIQYRALSLVTGEGLLVADTEQWRRQRPLVQPAFHHRTLETLVGHVVGVTDDVRAQWRGLPAGAVVVPGNLPSKDGRYSLYAAVIVKKVDAQTRAKTSINELLRD